MKPLFNKCIAGLHFRLGLYTSVGISRRNTPYAQLPLSKSTHIVQPLLLAYMRGLSFAVVAQSQYNRPATKIPRNIKGKRT